MRTCVVKSGGLFVPHLRHDVTIIIQIQTTPSPLLVSCPLSSARWYAAATAKVRLFDVAKRTSHHGGRAGVVAGNDTSNPELRSVDSLSCQGARSLQSRRGRTGGRLQREPFKLRVQAQANASVVVTQSCCRTHRRRSAAAPVPTLDRCTKPSTTVSHEASRLPLKPSARSGDAARSTAAAPRRSCAGLKSSMLLPYQRGPQSTRVQRHRWASTRCCRSAFLGKVGP